MFAITERMVPVMARSSGVTGDRVAWPSSTFISTLAGIAIERLPLGPFVVMVPSWIFSSTPFGRAMGFLAIRDIAVTPLGHEAQDFATDALLARLRVGHDALRGGNDGDAEAVEDLRQLGLATVVAQARARHALHALDDRAAFVVFQLDLELGLGAVLGHARSGDVALVLQDLGDGHLDLGRRHLHRRLADGRRIAHAGQHIGDGISHAHGSLPLSAPISAGLRISLEPAPGGRLEPCYQLALRRPGTSPRMVASRSLLRPRPNLLYTARGRPVSAQRVVWRDGEESRGSFCSLTAASIFS